MVEYKSLNKRRFKGNDVGILLLNSMLVSQWVITITAVVLFLYNNILHRGTLSWANTTNHFMRPIQMFIGSIFLIWWIRSNSWTSPNLPVNTKIRMIVFQYSIVSIYLAFDAITQRWETEIDEAM